MTAGFSPQPTVKNREWMPGAKVGWAWGKRRQGLHLGKERTGHQDSKRGGVRKERAEGPGLLGLREEGWGPGLWDVRRR